MMIWIELVGEDINVDTNMNLRTILYDVVVEDTLVRYMDTWTSHRTYFLK